MHKCFRRPMLVLAATLVGIVLAFFPAVAFQQKQCNVLEVAFSQILEADWLIYSAEDKIELKKIHLWFPDGCLNETPIKLKSYPNVGYVANYMQTISESVSDKSLTVNFARMLTFNSLNKAEVISLKAVVIDCSAALRRSKEILSFQGITEKPEYKRVINSMGEQENHGLACSSLKWQRVGWLERRAKARKSGAPFGEMEKLESEDSVSCRCTKK